MEVKECLPNLVGITDIECNCTAIPNDKTYNITESDTGYFLTDYIDLKIADLQCDSANDLFDRLNKILGKGFDEFSLLLQEDAKKQSTPNPRLKPYQGTVGTSNPLTSTESVGRWQGFRITPRNIEHTEMRVDKVYVKLKTNLAETRTFRILDNYGNEYFRESVDSSTNLMVTFNVNTTLPLYDEEEEGDLIYYFVHDIQEFRHNQYTCGCGGEKAKRHKYYVTMSGTKTDNINGYEEHADNKSAFGMRIQSEMICSFQDHFCSMTTEQKRQYAFGVLNMATIKLIEWLLSRNEINEFTIHGSKELEGKAELAYIEAQNAAKWLNYDVDLYPCWVCGQKGYGVQGILK